MKKQRIHKNIAWALFLICPVFINSCTKPQERTCFKSNGVLITTERQLESFHKIELYNNINLTIINDTIDMLNITAPENLLSFIKTDNNNGVLTIRNDNKCNWLRSFNYAIEAVLHTKSLQAVDYRGSGNITNQGFIEQEHFEINIYDGSGLIDLKLRTNDIFVKLHNGPADVLLNGQSERALVYNAGEGYIYMQNYDVHNLNIRHIGTGDCHVKSFTKMDISLEYVGDIHYYGNPSQVTKHISGSGNIFKH